MEKDKFVKKSVSFPESLLSEIEAAAGANVSAWVQDACRAKLAKRSVDVLADDVLLSLVKDTLGRPSERDLRLILEARRPAVNQTNELEDILWAYVQEQKRNASQLAAEPRAAGGKK